jgi:acetoin utilization deacetylase AcuC-like enzyme
MRKTAFIYDESYFWHNAGGGALFEPASKYLQDYGSVESPEVKRRFKNLLEKSGLMDRLEQIKPTPAIREQLMAFHTERHIDNVKALSRGQGGDCGDSAIVSQGSYEIAKLSTGGAITAVETVVTNPLIDTAYALCRPPGHHGEADRGFGFCIFNNGVVAVKHAQAKLGIGRIAIVDWDAHHGNGTEDAFYEDDSVLYISIHQEGLDPVNRGNIEDRGIGKGKGYTINIPLPAGSGDGVYKYAFEQVVIPVIEEFEPELIIVLAGQDANPFDPLARMMVSADGYGWMTKQVKSLADRYAKGRLVCLHEGGYCPAYVPFCSHAIVEELTGITTDVEDPFIYAMAGTTYRELLPHQKARVDEIKKPYNANVKRFQVSK